MAVDGTLWVGVNFHLSAPDWLELTHVTSEPVSSNQLHFILLTVARTC